MKNGLRLSLGALLLSSAASVGVLGVVTWLPNRAEAQSVPPNFITSQRPSVSTISVFDTSASAITFTGGTGTITNGQLSGVTGGILIGSGGVVINAPPKGAVHHQVVDKWFDAEGGEIKISSRTHLVDADCHSGARRPAELIAQDDGKGNVKFARLLMPGEPATGTKPITQADLVTAKLGISRAAPITVPIERPTELAAAHH